MNISWIDKLDVRVQQNNTYGEPDGLLLPKRAHDGDAGLDLCAANDTTMPFNKRILVNTGIAVRIPYGYVGLLVPRSSLSKKGIMMTNSCGIIDSQYRGNIMASLIYNNMINSELNMTLEKYERIVQLLSVPIALPKVNEVWEEGEEWNNTYRGTGGFGSTGK